MGLEADCAVGFGGRSSRGHVRFEETEIVFRGDFRLKVPLKDVLAVGVQKGRLVLELPNGRATFDLGDKAERWAEKIRSPRGLLDKLGLEPGQRVAVIGVKDDSLLREMKERVPDASVGRLKKEVDLIFLGLEEVAGLARLPALRAALKPAGAIWVFWPKGRKALREDDVRAAALAHGLVDVKVVSVSDALSGLKLMIPRAQRGA